MVEVSGAVREMVSPEEERFEVRVNERGGPVEVGAPVAEEEKVAVGGDGGAWGEGEFGGGAGIVGDCPAS